MTNTNPQTGIRYGTIYLNSLDPNVADELFFGSQATNLSEQRAYEELKHEIERDAEGVEDEVRIAIAERDYAMLSNDNLMEREVEAAFQRLGYADRDDYIDTRLELESQDMQIEEPTISGTLDGVKYEISWLGGAPLLFVLESPVTGHFSLCSPCVPGAVSIDCPNPDGELGYGIPEDWYDHNEEPK